LGKPLETFVLSYFNYFCLICSLQSAESLNFANKPDLQSYLNPNSDFFLVRAVYTITDKITVIPVKVLNPTNLKFLLDWCIPYLLSSMLKIISCFVLQIVLSKHKIKVPLCLASRPLWTSTFSVILVLEIFPIYFFSPNQLWSGRIKPLQHLV